MRQDSHWRWIDVVKMNHIVRLGMRDEIVRDKNSDEQG
jgi:hypothetical protein